MKGLFISIILLLIPFSFSFSNPDKINLSGNTGVQYVNVSKRTARPLQVFVTNSGGKPLAGQLVYFTFIEIPDGSTDYLIEKKITLTDSSGRAATFIKAGTKSGVYKISAIVSGTEPGDMVIFSVHARKTNWFILMFTGLIGGLGLFLYGMVMMSAGLQKSAGDKMRSILGKLTHNRFMAFLVGIFVTTILQSSSATSVMLVSFVNSKLMKFRQTIGIFMGAAVGTTITVQIIAFNISEYSLLFVGIGFFVFFLAKKQMLKNSGEAILGFGILFFGMFTMAQAMSPLKNYEPFIKALTFLENPIAGVLIGMTGTALIQSSGAFIGIIIVLANQGLLNLGAAIPLLIGTNIGTTITGLLASMQGTRESKKVSVAFSLYKLTGALILIWWIPGFVHLVETISFSAGGGSPEGAGRQIANAHTLYNVFLALIFFPLGNGFEKVMNRLIPSHETEQDELKTKYLDETFLKTPSLALSLAKKETLRMMKTVEKMADIILIPFTEKNISPLADIEKMEEKTDFLRDRINDYLIKISKQDTSGKRVEEAFNIMFTVNEFEQMADVISFNLKEKAGEWCESGIQFSSEGKEELIAYHKNTMDQIRRACELYNSFDRNEAQKMKEKYKEYRKTSFEMEKSHFGRLMNQVEGSAESSNMHIELVTLFKLIASHATNTARILTTK